MAFCITEALYDWMHKRRIVSAVAQQMGKNSTTLSAELRPHRSEAKLGADDLVPLFEAIRAIGYGSEMRGILHRFITELKGEELRGVADADLVPHILQLARGFGIFSECAARVPTISDEQELVRLRTMLRTEILPALLKMEDTIERRLTSVRKTHPTLTVSVEPLFGNSNS